MFFKRKPKKDKTICPICDGKGRIIISKHMGIGKHFAHANERCPLCEGKGYLQ